MKRKGIEGVDVEEMGSVHEVLQVRQLADGDVEEGAKYA